MQINNRIFNDFILKINYNYYVKLETFKKIDQNNPLRTFKILRAIAACKSVMHYLSSAGSLDLLHSMVFFRA